MDFDEGWKNSYNWTKINIKMYNYQDVARIILRNIELNLLYLGLEQ
jgi:hypothetical protein